MNDYEHRPGGRPVDIHLHTLRSRMSGADFRLLLDAVEPALRAIDEHRLSPVESVLDGYGDLPEAVREEALLVIATAVTGRLDNEVVDIDFGDGPVRVITDAETASDPERLSAIVTCLRERRRIDEELRGIAEASGLPTDL
ncbi:hypothetical protein [Streptomyces sp. TRM68416]|uniref:hypothetical protein n=1 Tax=Streptomyces sp. TRM68416 TaxID=2758412 RepID=UPI0016620931|nr:hypothetical protein [Streptomyces sp. TRM68416]MBD0844704.1 hypothetical protein [Streptomyces sp. TRM68416]